MKSKNKKSPLAFVSLLLLLSATSFANVNLDAPVLSGSFDKVYRSAIDPAYVYYFPVALVKTGEAEIYDVDRYSTRARFNVGVAEDDIHRVAASLKAQNIDQEHIRTFRPINIQVENGVDLPPGLNPKVVVLGAFSFDGTSSIAILIDSVRGRWGRVSSGTRFFTNFFENEKADNVAIVRYEFSSTLAGAPKASQTAVAILAGKQRYYYYDEIFPAPAPAQPAQQAVYDDELTGCWNKILPGQICVKKQN